MGGKQAQILTSGEDAGVSITDNYHIMIELPARAAVQLWLTIQAVAATFNETPIIVINRRIDETLMTLSSLSSAMAVAPLARWYSTTDVVTNFINYFDTDFYVASGHQIVGNTINMIQPTGSSMYWQGTRGNADRVTVNNVLNYETIENNANDGNAIQTGSTYDTISLSAILTNTTDDPVTLDISTLPNTLCMGGFSGFY